MSDANAGFLHVHGAESWRSTGCRRLRSLPAAGQSWLTVQCVHLVAPRGLSCSSPVPKRHDTRPTAGPHLPFVCLSLRGAAPGTAPSDLSRDRSWVHRAGRAARPPMPRLRCGEESPCPLYAESGWGAYLDQRRSRCQSISRRISAQLSGCNLRFLRRLRRPDRQVRGSCRILRQRRGYSRMAVLAVCMG